MDIYYARTNLPTNQNIKIYEPADHYRSFQSVLFLATEMGGHTGASKSYSFCKMILLLAWHVRWICALTAGCLTYQNN